MNNSIPQKRKTSKNEDMRKFPSSPIILKRTLKFIMISAAFFVPINLSWMIINGSHMQYYDYFNMVGSLLAEDGSLTLSGLFNHANEHLVLVPKIIYLINIYFFHGSNISLGVFVFLIAAATAVIIARNMHGNFCFESSDCILLAWLISTFLFPLSAAHNFLFAMSGTCWLLANFFTVCAIISLVNDKPIQAGIFGGFGTFSYGTGLAIWPALLFVLLLKKKKLAWHDYLMLILGIASVVFERLTSVSVIRHPPLEVDIFLILRSLTITVGSILSNNIDVAMLIGSALLTLSGFALIHLLFSDSQTKTAIILAGIIAYALVVFVLFGMSRAGFGDGIFSSSRYMGVAGLFAFATLSLSLIIFNNNLITRLSTGVAIVLSLSASVQVTKTVKELSRFEQNLGAIAAKLDVANGLIRGYESNTTSILKAFSHYPFNSLGDKLGCGLIGGIIDSPLPVGSNETHGLLEKKELVQNSSAVKVTGWVYSKNTIECVLLINRNNEVVGAAIVGWVREDARIAVRGLSRDIGWEGVTRSDGDNDFRAVIRLLGHTDFVELASAR